jgi:hypothetical protein
MLFSLAHTCAARLAGFNAYRPFFLPFSYQKSIFHQGWANIHEAISFFIGYFWKNRPKPGTAFLIQIQNNLFFAV